MSLLRGSFMNHYVICFLPFCSASFPPTLTFFFFFYLTFWQCGHLVSPIRVLDKRQCRTHPSFPPSHPHKPTHQGHEALANVLNLYNFSCLFVCLFIKHYLDYLNWCTYLNILFQSSSNAQGNRSMETFWNL